MSDPKDYQDLHGQHKTSLNCASCKSSPTHTISTESAQNYHINLPPGEISVTGHQNSSSRSRSSVNLPRVLADDGVYFQGQAQAAKSLHELSSDQAYHQSNAHSDSRSADETFPEAPPEMADFTSSVSQASTLSNKSVVSMVSRNSILRNNSSSTNLSTLQNQQLGQQSQFYPAMGNSTQSLNVEMGGHSGRSSLSMSAVSENQGPQQQDLPSVEGSGNPAAITQPAQPPVESAQPPNRDSVYNCPGYDGDNYTPELREEDKKREAVLADLSGDSKVVGSKYKVKSIDMTTKLMDWIFDRSEEAFELHKMDTHISRYIKQKLDEKFGSQWHVIIGKSFGSSTSHQEGTFIYFYMNNYAVLVWKTTSRQVGN